MYTDFQSKDPYENATDSRECKKNSQKINFNDYSEVQWRGKKEKVQ